MTVITVDITNEQTHLPVDGARLEAAVRDVLQEASIAQARISVAVVDDPVIAELHERYLHQSDPTDVLSFLLERSENRLEGEVVVSAETAAGRAPEFGWGAEEELLLYVVHGTLHLVGYDDTTPEGRAEMQRQEKASLARLGIEARHEESIAATKGPHSGGNRLP